jgi:hypothetical protein
VPATQAGSVGKITCTVTDTQIDCRVDTWNAETARSGAHIHVSPAGVNGPIVCDASVARVAGDLGYSFTCNQANLRPARAQGIDTFANFVNAVASCGAYFNEHTELRPSGNVRGQLVPKGRNPFTGINDCVGLTND